MREQRENFLPLRVIRDRLETGAIDDSGGIAMPSLSGNGPVAADGNADPAGTPDAGGSTTTQVDSVATAAGASNVSQLHQPRGLRNVRIGADGGRSGALDLDDTGPMGHVAADDTGGYLLDDPTGTISPHADQVNTHRHPAAQGRSAVVVGAGDHTTSMASSLRSRPSDVYDRGELCNLAGVTQTQLAELESYGLVAGRGTGSSTTFTGRSRRGARRRRVPRPGHRRQTPAVVAPERPSASRVCSSSGYLPLLRQRNPQARQDAVQLLGELADLGAELREALVVSMLRHHLDT